MTSGSTTIGKDLFLLFSTLIPYSSYYNYYYDNYYYDYYCTTLDRGMGSKEADG
jgi:hypothetical protein